MRYPFLVFFIVALFLGGCAQKEPVPTPPPVIDNSAKRETIVASALSYLNKKDGKDCSGFVSLVNQKNGEPYFKQSEIEAYFEDSRRSLAIYNLFEARKRLFESLPKRGDLIFFANTIKAYSAKKAVDNITHIGIVTRIDSDETVHFIHNIRGRNVIGYINFRFPTHSMYDNKIINSYMEKCSPSQNCLAPNYFSAYGMLP